jgi:hypothetical protein
MDAVIRDLTILLPRSSIRWLKIYTTIDRRSR